MIKKKLLVYKPVCMTPLQAINEFKNKNPEYRNEKISYAGRLDPMAEGVMVLLVGEENKKRHEYENMEKEYEFEVLLGVSSDTYDILGIVKDSKKVSNREISNRVIESIPGFVGKQSQPFPPYSSKPVDGRPLYWWARAGRLDEIEIPVRDININEIKHLKTSSITAEKMAKIIYEKINLVDGDFRQLEIVESWESFFEKNLQEEFLVMKFSAVVSSGTYIRSIAQKMGEKMGISSLAFSIKRTRIGKFNLSQAIKLD